MVLVDDIRWQTLAGVWRERGDERDDIEDAAQRKGAREPARVGLAPARHAGHESEHAEADAHGGNIVQRGYTPPVPAEPSTNGADTGFPDPESIDVEALFAALRDEVRRSGADPGGATDPDDRRAARGEAERLWPVSADRSLRLRPGLRGGVGTPVKAVLRKAMRWYVEPLAYDQRSFNAATLRLVDDLQEQVDRLQAELAAPRDEKR